MINENEAMNIISNGYLRSVYQPIVSLKDGMILAYEALSRITLEEATLTIGELFENASKMGCLWELEKICRMNALKNGASKPKDIKLFLNVDGNVLQDSKFEGGFTKEALKKYGLNEKDIVFEITERSSFADVQIVCEILRHYESQGFEVAIDDLGSGYSGLNRLQCIQPGYVKIDYELVHEIHKDKAKRSIVRMLVHHCEEMGHSLIAEGIEKEEELKCLINLGVDYGQGFFLGKPEKDFETISNHVVKTIMKFQKDRPDKNNKMGNICKMGTVLYPSCSIEHAVSVFCQNKNLEYIAVVDSSCRFYGIVKKDVVMAYVDEKKSTRKNLEDIMEKEILQIDSDKSLKNGIGKLMTRDEKNFYAPFVILKKGRYYGIATVRDMVVAIGKVL